MKPAPPLRAIWRVLCAIGAFAIGVCLSIWLWSLWAAGCNEACPDTVVVGMLVFLALFPVLCTAVTVGAQATHWRVATQFAVIVAVLAVILGLAAYRAQIAESGARTSEKAAGLR